MSLQLLGLFHLHTKVWNPLVHHILGFQCTFFQSVFWVIAFGQDGFGFSPFYFDLKEYFLFQYGLFYLPTKSYIRKPANTRNDQLENPKP
jgi:hypothetical protein